MAYHEQGSYIIRARAVAHNEYNIVLKVSSIITQNFVTKPETNRKVMYYIDHETR